MENKNKPMEISNEVKAKVFASYWGQKVYGDLQDDNEQANYGIVDMDFDNFEFCVAENMRLVLRSLANITDEDAIEVAKLAGYMQNRTRLASIGKSVALNLAGKLGHEWRYVNTWAIYQYLQSKGYSLPSWYLGGKTPIEAGIAVEMDTQTE